MLDRLVLPLYLDGVALAAHSLVSEAAILDAICVVVEETRVLVLRNSQ